MNEEEIESIYNQARDGSMDEREAYEKIVALGGDEKKAADLLLWEPDRVVITENE